MVNSFKDLTVWQKSIIGQKIGYFQNINKYIEDITEIKKMLNGLISSLKRKVN